MPLAQYSKLVLYDLLDKLPTNTDDPLLDWVAVGT